MLNETKYALKGLSVCVLCVITLVSAFGQAEPNKDVAEAIKRVKQGDFLAVHVEEIAQAGAVEAIPALKEQFARKVETSDKDEWDPGNKEMIASALVRLGEKDAIYWDFLLKQATDAVDNNAPYPGAFDAQGKTIPRSLSPEFVEWAKSHHLVPELAAENAMYKLAGKVNLLAETGDQHGLTLLRRAMSSRNYVIQAVAAKGLAKLQDKESIPQIIEACQRAPIDVAPAIAEALVYFDDPRAKSAAEAFLPEDFVQALRDEKRVAQHDPFAQ